MSVVSITSTATFWGAVIHNLFVVSWNFHNLRTYRIYFWWPYACIIICYAIQTLWLFCRRYLNECRLAHCGGAILCIKIQYVYIYIRIYACMQHKVGQDFVQVLQHAWQLSCIHACGHYHAFTWVFFPKEIEMNKMAQTDRPKLNCTWLYILSAICKSLISCDQKLATVGCKRRETVVNPGQVQ